MDQLHCNRRAQRRLRVAANRLAGGPHQQRAQALAAVEHSVAHRFAQAGRGVAGHPCLEGILDHALLERGPGFEVVRLHAPAAHGLS